MTGVLLPVAYEKTLLKCLLIALKREIVGIRCSACFVTIFDRRDILVWIELNYLTIFWFNSS